MKIKIPNYLTIGRIIIVPIFVITFYLPGFYGDVIPFALFLIASFTDFLDGLLARMYKEESKLGELLDPIADKIIVATALILLVMAGTIKNYEVIAAIIILTREILISGLREFLAIGKIKLPVSPVNKTEIAIICKNVLALARLDTGRLILPFAKNSLNPEIKISLVKIIIAAITSRFFMIPFITNNTKAAATKILSAIGSSNSPNLDSSL